MRFLSFVQFFVVLATALAFTNPTVHKEAPPLGDTGLPPSATTLAVKKAVDTTLPSSSPTLPAEDAAKEEIQQAKMLLASMPTCGVSELGRFLAALTCC